ncbi:MAG: hypothetical protein ACOC5J_03765 [Gemmatimonadota bacterium]
MNEPFVELDRTVRAADDVRAWLEREECGELIGELPDLQSEISEATGLESVDGDR